MHLLLLGFAESPIQLVPDGTIVFHLAIIILMVALLNATLLKPINRVLEERDRLTKGRLNEAERILLKIDQELLEYERRLRAARAEGYALMEQDRSTLARERERRVAEIRENITHELLGQKQKIRIEIGEVKLRLQQDARNIAFEISRQILHRPIIGQRNITNGRS